jgi:hypothetical protein
VADYRITQGTPEQALRVISDAINQVFVLSQSTITANVCLLAPAEWAHISTTYVSISSGGSSTILSLLRQAHPDVFFDYCVRCTGAGIDGSNVIFAYNRDPSSMQLAIPNDFEQLEPYWDGSNWTIKCLEEFGGIRYYYTAAILTIGV